MEFTAIVTSISEVVLEEAVEVGIGSSPVIEMAVVGSRTEMERIEVGS